MRRTSIILTGASGFVGQNLKPFLQESGHEVCSLSLRGNWISSFPPNKDAIIHLAGKAHDVYNVATLDDYFAVNTELTKRLFDTFLQSSVKDFIFFSSVKAAADNVKGILSEDENPNPLTPYGKSKLEAERYIMSRTMPEGKRIVILRPCMIHGAGNKGNLNLLYRVIKNGIPYPFAAFENRRSFLSIDNLMFFIEKILETPFLSSGIYNLADDVPLSTNDVVKIIGEGVGIKPKLLALSPSMVGFIARAGDFFSLPLNSEKLRKLTGSYVVSNIKIKNALRIASLPISSHDGLLQTIRTFDKPN